jgi:hypothetical protein
MPHLFDGNSCKNAAHLAERFAINSAINHFSVSTSGWHRSFSVAAKSIPPKLIP